MKARILVVEDERIIAYDIKSCLEKAGYIVPTIAAYGERAIEIAEESQPDLVLMDIMLKGNMNGIEAAEQIMNRFDIPVVYLTAYSDDSTLKRAKNSQPFGYILKPFEENQLITTIEIALNKHQTEMVIRADLKKEKQMREFKSNFVSMVSHEFRNPLTTIETYTDLLTSYAHQLNEAKKSEYLCHIQNAVKHMTDLMSDVLLIGKAEVNQLIFNPAPLDVESFCKDLVTEVQFSAGDQHNVIFTTQGQYGELEETTCHSRSLAIKTFLPCLDEKLLRHILGNLLANAVKYSPFGGTVRFDLFFVEGEVMFRIQDEGIGIPEYDQEDLFNSFHRGSNVGNIPGHGLGLAIVKQYVELHRGEISFASKVGVGTTFIVSLPVK
ncbi:MAG: ATP-binding protein [Rhizonema sp. PD38]|nr:ATP-binding protein [Rhizonema sp. PD38]